MNVTGNILLSNNSYLRLGVGCLVLLLLTLVAVVSCSSYGPRQQSGIDIETDVMIYFVSDISEEQITEFWNSVLSVPGSSGKGYDFLPGISGVSRSLAVDEHEALAVDFWPYATQEERDAVLERARASPLVYTVLQDVVPSEVNNLD